MSESPFVTVPELAAFLRVKVNTIYRWTARIGSDSIPRYRAGNRLVFRRDEVLAWFLDTQRVGGQPSRRRSRGNVVLARRRRRAPNGESDSQGGSGPGIARVSEDRSAARALAVPSENGGGSE